MAHIDRLDRLHGKVDEILQRAGALARRAVRAVLANLLVQAVNVGIDRAVVSRVHRVEQTRQIQLDPAALAKRRSQRVFSCPNTAILLAPSTV